MSTQHSIDAFRMVLAGARTGITDPVIVNRAALTQRHLEIRLAVTRESARAQFESPLISGDELHFSASAWTTDTRHRVNVPAGEIEAQIEAFVGPEAARHLLTFGDVVEQSGSVHTAHRFLLADEHGGFYTPTPLQYPALERAFGMRAGEKTRPLGIVARG